MGGFGKLLKNIGNGIGDLANNPLKAVKDGLNDEATLTALAVAAGGYGLYSAGMLPGFGGAVTGAAPTASGAFVPGVDAMGIGSSAAGIGGSSAAAGAGGLGGGWASYLTSPAGIGTIAQGVGGILQSGAANSAANAQTRAIDAATKTSNDQFNAIQARDAPLVDARNQSLIKMRQLLGIDPGGGDATAALAADPGYQFGLQQGNQARQNALNARGMRNSGAALMSADRFGQDYATTKTNDAFNRLASVAQLGQVGANSLNQYGAQNASNIAGNQIAAGNVGATNALAQGNILANTGNQLAGWYANNSRPTFGTSPTNSQLEQQYYLGGP